MEAGYLNGIYIGMPEESWIFTYSESSLDWTVVLSGVTAQHIELKASNLLADTTGIKPSPTSVQCPFDSRFLFSFC